MRGSIGTCMYAAIYATRSIIQSQLLPVQTVMCLSQQLHQQRNVLPAACPAVYADGVMQLM